MIGIYAIMNTINGKVYIGSAVNLEKRRRAHFNALCRGKHVNKHLQAAWNLHGAEAFTFTVLTTCEKEELLEWEQIYLDEVKFENKYNFSPTAGSNLGLVMSEEQRRKISAARKGKKFGPLSAEHRLKISESHKGIKKGPMSDEQKCKIGKALLGNSNVKGKKRPPFSNEHRRRMAMAQKGRIRPDLSERNMANKGKKRGPMSEETKRKISEAKLGKPLSEETKRKLSESARQSPAAREHRRKLAESRKGKQR